MRIATWNVNGINARLHGVLTWLDEVKPDIVGLQEIKCIDENFPRAEFEARGYNVETHGQKGFNGVALLSRIPFDEVHRGLPGDDTDEQARLIEGVFSTEGGVVRVCNIYLPNGNPVESEKFPYKLGWMDRLHAFARTRLAFEEPFILMGDFNLIPTGHDCHDPKVWWGDALFRPESLEKFRALSYLGLTDALRATTDDAAYTFWDFQGGAWRRNNGIRIDHLMLSAQAADRLKAVKIHKDLRSWDKPSDHVPVEGDFALTAINAAA
ncbi:exodeoxyribonuclease III [Pelagibacterium xiamenense]|uniref:exodeoxyribonuclease III n=1 Tax=Pelagibacterium xiamenense TaxID=2901140 RepID=UPI001E3B78BD|nr:exodeoxyribonuclease III [Pelagibacterium xiamenense]MCD7061064.1 exodeoxyribonuclease III [Pelagibacterium xiamenense]